MIGIIIVSEELGVFSLPYPNIEYIEFESIVADGDDCLVTALLSSGRISIESDSFDLGQIGKGAVLGKPVVFEDLTFDYWLT